MVTFSPSASAQNVLIYMSLSALTAPQFEMRMFVGASFPANEITRVLNVLTGVNCVGL